MRLSFVRRSLCGNAGIRWVAALALVLAAASHAAAEDTVFYVGSGANTVLQDALALPDGTVLVGGGSDSLDWLPKATPRVELPADAVEGKVGGQRVAFVLHLSADLQQVLHVAAFPPGTAQEVRRLALSGVPGSGKIGDLFLSITTDDNRNPDSGYAIVALNGNFVDGVPHGVRWIHNVWAGKQTQALQPWDVGSDGKVVYARGVEYANDWVSIHRLGPDGRDDVVEHWRYHKGVTADGQSTDGHWTPASAREGVKPTGSGVVFKIGRPDLRSWTEADFTAEEPDGNGKTRKGRWPNDFFFSGPASPEGDKAPWGGYTGYKPGRNPTHRIGAINIDRRDGSIYVGYSVQSRLPDGLPDFEPAVIAWDADGKLRWWSRLYHQDPPNSPPDQYIDRMAIDYANNNLVVGARSHGNNTVNFWNGSGTFKTRLNGQTGNVHITWLGALALKDGKFVNATWLAELADSSKRYGKPMTAGPLKGWPNPNDGWADLNTTRLSDLEVEAGTGRVLVIGTGRRPYTTVDAYQPMLKPGEGSSMWSDFARVYEPLFKGLVYSSVLNARREDTQDAKKAVELNAIAISSTGDALFVAGQQIADQPAAAPLSNVPAWGSEDPSAAAILARLEMKQK
jgi:hypothetical protein